MTSLILAACIGQLVSPEVETKYRSLVPSVENREVQEILKSGKLLFYDHHVMPGAYQDWDSQLPGVHSVDFNVSANKNEPHGNANKEFPWSGPAGLYYSPGVESFKIVYCPPGSPEIVWYRFRFPGDRHDGIAWTFPRGAIVFEVMYFDRPNPQAFEMRITESIAANDDWAAGGGNFGWI